MKNTYIPKGGCNDEKNRYINSGEIKMFEVGHFSHTFFAYKHSLYSSLNKNPVERISTNMNLMQL